MKQAYLTISVDDGHPTDVKTAELLNSLGLKATFYIPRRNPERLVMTESEMKELSSTFEIGGHTLSHLSLTRMSHEDAWKEIDGGKRWLEDCLGRQAVSFCYPRGKFTSSVVAFVKKAGFLGARASFFNLHRWPEDPYRWGVSTHAYPHSQFIQLRHALLEGNWVGARNFLTIYKRSSDWELHFLHALDWVEEHGGIAHLYFHSWEIEEMNQWDKLKRVLQNSAGRKQMHRVTNGDLFRNWRETVARER